MHTIAPTVEQDTYRELYSRLAAWRQEHVLRWWQDISPQQREQLCREVEQLDLELLQRLYHAADSSEVSSLPDPAVIRPASVERLPASLQEGLREQRMGEVGRRALRAGQVAVVTVAGGQGTRLGHDGPKGTFSIAPVSGKSLFQIHAEKVLAVSRRYGAALPWYIMTGPENDSVTRGFFAENAFFGLQRGQVAFFQQGTMPALDRRTGKLLAAEKHRLATSPNGHGGVLQALADGGHLADMRRRGIDCVFFHQVDNPLVKIADPAYLGYHIDANAEMSLKVVRKLHAEEKLGVAVEVQGRLQIIEYSDLPPQIAERTLPDGTLELWAGSIAVHIFNLAFLEGLALCESMLPYHRAVKCVPYVDERGQGVQPAEANALKFEMFVFDALPLARKAIAVETDRREEFAPLKNAAGPNSPATVRQAISDLFAEWMRRAEIAVPCREDGSAAFPLEISPLLALDAEELQAKLRRRTVVSGPMLLGETTELLLH